MGPSIKSCELEIPLAVQIWKPLSVIPGGKSGLLHIGLKNDMKTVTVEITVTGLLQADFRDLRFLINRKFFKGNLDIELSISSQREGSTELVFPNIRKVKATL